MLIGRPLSTTPRMGRHLQRYDGDVRLVTGCVPLTGDGQVVMCSSASGDWILPKGGWEKDETAPEAAARESHEEAGVVGVVNTEPLVDVAFSNKRGEPCRLLLFVMDVQELCREWPESHVRQRRLFSLEEAMVVCRKKEHLLALEEVKLRGWRTLLGAVSSAATAIASTSTSIGTSASSTSTVAMTDMISSPTFSSAPTTDSDIVDGEEDYLAN